MKRLWLWFCIVSIAVAILALFPLFSCLTKDVLIAPNSCSVVCICPQIAIADCAADKIGSVNGACRCPLLNVPVPEDSGFPTGAMNSERN